MKNLKKYLAFFLVVVMVFSLCACTAKNEEPGNTDDKQSSVSSPADSDDGAVDAADTNELSWLRVGEAPLVDGKDITLKIGVMCDDVTTDPENTWMYKFIEECLGINVELEYFYAATRDESVALMMHLICTAYLLNICPIFPNSCPTAKAICTPSDLIRSKLWITATTVCITIGT